MKAVSADACSHNTNAAYLCLGLELGVVLSDQIEIFFIQILFLARTLFSPAFPSFATTLCFLIDVLFFFFIFVDNKTFPDLCDQLER